MGGIPADWPLRRFLRSSASISSSSQHLCCITPGIQPPYAKQKEMNRNCWNVLSLILWDGRLGMLILNLMTRLSKGHCLRNRKKEGAEETKRRSRWTRISLKLLSMGCHPAEALG